MRVTVLDHVYTDPERQITFVTSMCASSIWNVLHVTILGRFPEFWRMCALDGVIFQYIYVCPDRCGELHCSERFLIVFQVLSP